MGPVNGIMGDDNYGTNLPETQIDNNELKIEENLAKFSKSREFRALKNHLESRIEFYQQKLPNGQEMQSTPDMNDWIVANKIIAEFRAVLDTYEQANKALKQDG